jgi:hypothetical protein
MTAWEKCIFATLHAMLLASFGLILCAATSAPLFAASVTTLATASLLAWRRDV